MSIRVRTFTVSLADDSQTFDVLESESTAENFSLVTSTPFINPLNEINAQHLSHLINNVYRQGLRDGVKNHLEVEKIKNAAKTKTQD